MMEALASLLAVFRLPTKSRTERVNRAIDDAYRQRQRLWSLRGGR